LITKSVELKGLRKQVYPWKKMRNIFAASLETPLFYANQVQFLPLLFGR
jgi:hypothetical protein